MFRASTSSFLQNAVYWMQKLNLESSYGSWNLRQIGISNYSFFQPFSSLDFWQCFHTPIFLNFLCVFFGDLFLCFSNFEFFSWISSYLNSKYFEKSSNFQFHRFLTIFPFSDQLKNWYAYSLNQYLNIFFFSKILDSLVKFHPFFIQNT